MKDTMGAKHGQKNERTGTKANVSIPFRKTSNTYMLRIYTTQTQNNKKFIDLKSSTCA